MQQYKPIKDFVTRCHKNSQKVVFIHGTFDLLHKGHVKTLNDAKSRGDILIVGVDSDHLTKFLKGEKRPIIPQEDRKVVVENLKCVDLSFVITLSENDLSDLYAYFRDLYQYLDVDIVTSGVRNEFGGNHRKQANEVGIEYMSVGGGRIETTTSIIGRILIDNEK